MHRDSLFNMWSVSDGGSGSGEQMRKSEACASSAVKRWWQQVRKCTESKFDAVLCRAKGVGASCPKSTAFDQIPHRLLFVVIL